MTHCLRNSGFNYRGVRSCNRSIILLDFIDDMTEDIFLWCFIFSIYHNCCLLDSNHGLKNIAISPYLSPDDKKY